MNCEICGQPRGDDELILLDGRQICAECKPRYVQRLMEGAVESEKVETPEWFEERMIGAWELVRFTWRMFLKEWLAIVVLSLLVSVPINLILMATDKGDEESLKDVMRGIRHAQSLETLFGVIAALGIARIVADRMEGRRISIGKALTHALSRWIPGVWTSFLEGLIVGLLCLALIVPGIVWAGYYTFSNSVVSLRGRSGKSALDYSKSLVRGRWWAIMGRTLALAAAVLLPVVVIQTGAAMLPESRGLTLATDVGIDLCMSFLTVGCTVLFLNVEAVERRLQDGLSFLGKGIPPN
jgi:hypothetical protein